MLIIIDLFLCCLSSLRYWKKLFLIDYILQKIYSNVFYDCQFGFLPGRSTTHTLIHLTNKITEVFEDKQFGCGTFLDLSKAFDSIDHNILISKLRHYGIR